MKTSKSPYGCVLFLGLLFMQLAGPAQSPADAERRLTEYLDIQHERTGFSGVVMIAGSDGQVIEKATGLASRELGVAMPVDAKFKIASMTKSFTAMLVTLARKEGKLTLDDKIGLHLKGVPGGSWDGITIRHLMAHTSGIPHWAGFDHYWTEKAFLPLREEQILAEIYSMALASEPGTRFHYSSPAYYLLATIIKRVYADSFDNILQAKILDRLGMKESGTCNGLTILPGMSSGYHLVSGDSLVVAPPRSMATMKGGGNMYATAGDMTAWCRSFLSGHTWGSDVVEEVFTPVTDHPTHKDGARYGRGWYLAGPSDSKPEACHIGGGTFGFSAKAAVYPAHNVSIVILANVSFLPVDHILSDVEKIAFGRPFRMPERLQETVDLTGDELIKVTGTYRAASGMTLQVSLHEGRLYARLGANPPLELYAKNEYSFFANKIPVQFTFKTDETNTVKGLEATGRGRTDYFQKQ
ncbi:MAG: serine hydrolase [Cyclobacteriaceae bacterium]